MIDSFKITLSQINKLMWTSIALSVALLTLAPSEEAIDLLGIQLNVASATYIIPITILGLQLARLVLIRNAGHIIKISESKKDKEKLRELCLTYPLPQFMRWQMDANFEVFLLTIFQVLYEASIPVAITFFLYNRNIVLSNNWFAWIVFVIIIVMVISDHILKVHVYKKATGQDIKTPD